MSDRVCVVHVGTHKTGTTSLQYFLQANIEPLKRAGLAFSETGWYGVVPGNHHIAWDLLDGNFDNHVRAFREELTKLETSSMVLSAEDFSVLSRRPDHFKRFIDLIIHAGLTPKILVYLREQSGFAESMYAERIKHGSVEPFEEYVDTILEDGVHDVRGSSVEFRYDRMLHSFSALVGRENVLARPYMRAGANLAIFHDFLGAFERLVPGFRAAGLNLELHHPRINESLTFGALLGNAFAHLRPSEPLPQDGSEFFSRWVPEMPKTALEARFALLTPVDISRFAAAFAKPNDRLHREFDVQIAIDDASRYLADPTLTMLHRKVLAHCISLWR